MSQIPLDVPEYKKVIKKKNTPATFVFKESFARREKKDFNLLHGITFHFTKYSHDYFISKPKRMFSLLG